MDKQTLVTALASKVEHIGVRSRATARTISVESVIQGLLERGAETVRGKLTGNLRSRVKHGGKVANKYGYPAYTQVFASTLTIEGDKVYVGLGSVRWIAANKVSFSGAARASYDGPLWALYDGRVSVKTANISRSIIRDQILKSAPVCTVQELLEAFPE